MKFNASKFIHSASSSGPSATSHPMATKTSTIRSVKAVIGCTAPTGPAATGRVTSTRSSLSCRDSSAAEISASRFCSASLIFRRAWPIRSPASLRA